MVIVSPSATLTTLPSSNSSEYAKRHNPQASIPISFCFKMWTF
jgi:hypothetical protein